MQLLFSLIELHYQFRFVRVGNWKFRWRKLLRWTSPLRLRWSLRRFKDVSDQPYRDFLRLLLWPPWGMQHLPCATLPPPPRVLFADPEAVTKHYYRYDHVQRQLPLWARRDTPQRAFFRLYESICAADDEMIGYATEYFFFRPEPEWKLHLLPDPRDMPLPPSSAPDDPEQDKKDCAERLAVMARLMKSLEEVSNWRLELGLRRDGSLVERKPDGTPADWVPEVRPSWADQIPSLPYLLVLSRSWEKPNDLPADWDKGAIVIHRGALRTI